MNRRCLRAWARLNRHAFAIAYALGFLGFYLAVLARASGTEFPIHIWQDECSNGIHFFITREEAEAY